MCIKRLLIIVIGTFCLSVMTEFLAPEAQAKSTEESVLQERATRACTREVKHKLNDKTNYTASFKDMAISKRERATATDGITTKEVQLTLDYSTASQNQGQAVCIFEWSYNTNFQKYLANHYTALHVYLDDDITSEKLIME